MAFWDRWFAPSCEGCGDKIVGVEPIVRDGRKICAACEEKAVAEAERKKQEIEARRAAEEAARARMEGGKQFGSDPRYQR